LLRTLAKRRVAKPKENNKVVTLRSIESPIEDSKARLKRLNRMGMIADHKIMMIPSPETKRKGNILLCIFALMLRGFAGATFHIVLSES